VTSTADDSAEQGWQERLPPRFLHTRAPPVAFTLSSPAAP